MPSLSLNNNILGFKRVQYSRTRSFRNKKNTTIDFSDFPTFLCQPLHMQTSTLTCSFALLLSFYRLDFNCLLKWGPKCMQKKRERFSSSCYQVWGLWPMKTLWIIKTADENFSTFTGLRKKKLIFHVRRNTSSTKKTLEQCFWLN